jgi:hypothetical protein
VPAGWLAGLLVGVLESTPRLPPRVLLRRRWHRSPASPEKFGPTLTALVNDAAAGRGRQASASRGGSPCARSAPAGLPHRHAVVAGLPTVARVAAPTPWAGGSGSVSSLQLCWCSGTSSPTGEARMVIRPAGGDESGNGRRIGNGRCGDRRRGSARPRGLGSAAARSWQGGRVAAASSGCGGGPGVCRDDSAGDGIADAAGRA